MLQNHQSEMSQNEVSALNESVLSLQKQFEAFATTQDLLVTLISGNELDKNDKGMAGRLEQVEKNQDKFQRYIWMGMGGAMVIGFIFQYIWQYFKH
jgi:hypothetical protein